MATGTPEIGAHCTLPSCNVNDFLPIRCRCDGIFCRDHISPEAHSCSVIQTSGTDVSELSSVSLTTKIQRCAAEGCDRPSLEGFISEFSRADASASGRVAAVCERCQQAFCATHREASSHACTGEVPKEAPAERNLAARKLLLKVRQVDSKYLTSRVGPRSNLTTAAGPSTSTVRNAVQKDQVQRLVMRHKAQPGDPRDKGKTVAMEDKLHIRVSVAESDKEQKPFWFRKTAGTGRALDLLASHFGLAASQPTSLHKKVNDTTVRLQNDKTLGEQVKDGDDIILTR